MRGAIRRVLLATVGLVGISLPAVALTVAAAPVAQAGPSTCTGNLKVTNTDTHTDIGFVSKVWNSFGEYVVTTTPSDYLSVSLTPGTQQNVTALNPQDPSFPLVGGIVGFAANSNNLGVGSPNYTYLGGTTATAPGATPQGGANAFTAATGIPEAIESAIWTINDANQLSPQWINTDSSRPATHLMDITNILVLTGDTTAFQNTFGPASNVLLTFVPTAPCTDNDLGRTGVPGNITTPSTGSSGAVVTYTPPTATDEGGGDPSAAVVCSPASGSTFPVGTTTVTCTATDADDSNSPVTATFTVTVTDSDLALTGVPANITVPSTSSSGAVVTYPTPTATDEEQGATVVCSPASGSVFPIGTTTVTCTATDADDTNSPVSATFTVTVKDDDLHLTGVPANITTVINANGGAHVTYTAPTVVDEEMGAAVVCSPGSGSLFPIGTTTVTCVATDGDDTNSPVTATFKVTVTKAPTTTGVTANPTNPTLGTAITFTATVAPTAPNPVTPTGSVSFFVDGSATPVATVPLGANGKATFTTAGLGAGPHTVTATYSGDGNFLGSSGTTSTVTVGCTRTITAGNGAVVLGAGSTCIVGGTVSGSIVVPRGASLDLEGVTVTGSITANAATFFRMCGSTAGSVTVQNSTGFVLIGDPGDDNCASNTINGSLTLRSNTGGVEAIGNFVAGAVIVSGNSGTGPFPEDTAPEIEGNGH